LESPESRQPLQPEIASKLLGAGDHLLFMGIPGRPEDAPGGLKETSLSCHLFVVGN
jgi:hypothetical protein